jgi:hypothetical protein
VGLFRRTPRALVASATRLTSSNKQNGRDVEAWQQRALRYYNTNGEIRFCSAFYARMLARVRFFPATVENDGTLEQIEFGPAVDILDRIQDPGGGRRRIQYDYGRLMFVTGEGALFVSEDDGTERWRFLWRDELELDDRTGVAWRKNAKGARIEQGTAYRMWTPNPTHSDLADSPIRAVLDIAEELNILTAAVRATAVSRMLNGMILLPTEVSPPPEESGQDDDPQKSPFLSMFTEHVRAQIEDPASAEAKVPFLLEAAYEYLDQVRWLQLHDPQSDYLERDLRIEAIKRLGLGLDMPPEALEGFSNTNHWAAQQIQWDMWRSHGVPIADQFALDLADVILRPMLREQGVPWEDVTIGYDDSQVIISPDQTAVADQAMDRAAIGFEGYRKMKGIPEDYAPTEKEQKFVFGIKTRDPVVAGLEEAAPAVRGPTAPPGVSRDGQANTPPSPTGGRTVSRQESMTASIVGAAHLALAQCRSKAGARLVSVVRRPSPGAQRCPECEQAISDVPNSMVASALGPEMIFELAKKDPIALVAGGTNDFKSILSEWGVRPSEVAVLCQRIEAYAAKTLFDSKVPDLPPGFTSHVEQSLRMSEHAVQAK